MASLVHGREILLFGESGTIRDYIHVDDIAQGIIAALKRGAPGFCYNIGSGVGKSNRDVLNAIFHHAKAAGLEPRIRTEPLRLFDVPANVLDFSKLRNETGWRPMVSFEEGIKKTWEWFLHNHGVPADRKQ